MKNTLKGYLIGVLSTVLLLGTVCYAASNTKTIEAIYNNIKIYVDGTKINPKDANGKTVEPFIYNGTTYLPVRAVANALGKAVYWDGPNYTVYLGQAPIPGSLPYPTVELENMVSINQSVTPTNKLTDNYGNTYTRAVYNDYDHYKFEYLLNMKYSRFKGTLYVAEGENKTNSVYLKIIADGKTIYTSPEMTRTSAPVDIDVNVTGYNDVKIEFSDRRTLDTNKCLVLCLGDAGFYQ